MSGFVSIDGIKVPIEGEKNVLALCKKAKIDIPTFCYHSELSTYGACRLCLVEINGKDIDASCVVPPKDGMSIRTNTAKIRSMRKMNLELLLANHKQDCPSCERSASCKLRDLSAKMGIRNVRFKSVRTEKPLDLGSPSLVRDPNKCILCGDCVRYCAEIQGIGAIDFTHRGSDVVVSPAFGKSLGEVDCVNCGQCAAVCPTAAIVPKSHIDQVWQEIDDPESKVIVQIAPAVRVAIGERFGMADGENAAGQIATALRMLGFDKVYDTAFGADLTVIEEANEFVKRYEAGEKLPLFTSCCPGWVKFAEQIFPELLPNLSTCMSPQTMMGSIIREEEKKQTAELEAPQSGVAGSAKKVVVVSIMPCTAKKFEVTRKELSRDGVPLVNYALTTAELASMIEQAGLRFADLAPSSMDLPMGFATGAGIVFGNSGGVSEAVARYVGSGISGGVPSKLEFVDQIPGGGIRQASLELGDKSLTILSIQGLANAKTVVKEILAGTREAHIVEVMACPGGCIGGAGQPIDPEGKKRVSRAAGLRNIDSSRELRSTQENPFITAFYEKMLDGEIGGHRAHHLLHTSYSSRKRIQDVHVPLVRGSEAEKVAVKVCVGTSCFLKGSQAVLSEVLKMVGEEGLSEFVDVQATFCAEHCDKGPTVRVGGLTIHKADAQTVMKAMMTELDALKVPVQA